MVCNTALSIGFPDVCEFSSVANIAALRALAVTDLENGQNYVVNGSVTAGDGDGGVYAWVAGSLDVDDGRNVIRPTSLTALQAGRWKLVQQQDNTEVFTNLAASGGSALVGFLQAGTGAVARTLQSKAREEMSVTDFGTVGQAQANNFSATDDAPAIQKAIDACRDLGITTLRVPRGYYNLKSALVIQSPVQLIGDGFSECGTFGGVTILGGYGEPAVGTWFKMNCTGYSGLTFFGGGARGAKIDRIGITQDHPAPNAGWVPTDYQPVISIIDALGGVDIGDIGLIGVKNGIFADNSGRLNIERLRGQTFGYTLKVDRAYDVVRLNQAQMNSFWSGNVNVLTYQQANSETVIAGRVDDFWIDDLFALGGFAGIHLTDLGNGVATKAHVTVGHCDLMKFSILVDAANVVAHFAQWHGQGERAQLDGVPIPGSRGLYCTPAALGGQLTFGAFSSERVTDSCIYNGGNTTITVTSSTFENFNSTGNTAIVSATAPIRMLTYPIMGPGVLAASAIEYDIGVSGQDLRGVPIAADNAAAAALGVMVGGAYRTASGDMKWRTA
jgi:hypothetical protein